ncbi:hypothetical protein [Salinispora arenicola]|uniref:hypothetical protein n=1 Tax=Salinispora arenicola TaxID=168697 RepID=UPI001E2F1BAB|nr:hypothetical protein [Salinispora arenicola]
MAVQDGFARRGGLLVPADVVPIRPDVRVDVPAPVPAVEPEPEAFAEVDDRPDDQDGQGDGSGGRRGWRREPVTADELEARLEARRARVDVQRDDERQRRRSAADHRLDLADVDEHVSVARRRRRERERDDAEQAALAALYRRAARSGERARVRADIGRSAEMRALRVAMVQRGALVVGLPVLAGFAAWSTTGVQAGMVRLLDLRDGSPEWWVAWLVEPLLIAIVAGVIIVRAVLRTAGGDTDRRATIAEWTALATSIALNMFGGWHNVDGAVKAVGGALGHSVGALGAAGTAWLIGLIIDYASRARPWDGAPRLAELNVLPDGINRGKRAPDDRVADDLPDEVRALLADVQEAIAAGTISADPSGYAIHRRVMGGRGDKGRASRVAALAAGWRPDGGRS